MEKNFSEIWDEVMKRLENEVFDVAYSTYIEVLVPRLVDENTICILAPSDYFIDICKKKYLPLIQKALIDLTHKDYIILFESKETKLEPSEAKKEVVEEKPKEEEIKDVKQQKKMSKYEVALNPKYTFDSYVVGNNNRFAYAAAQSIVQFPGQKYNPFYIFGGVGLGKTHLMHAIGNELQKNNPNLNIVCTTGELFSNELISTIMTNKNEDFREKYRQADILLVDDVQFLAGKEKCQEEFFHTFDALFQSGKQIILTSEKSPKEILLEDRLKTRFEMGIAADIQAPDYETRLAILRKKMQLERYVIDDDVLVKIASKVKSNVRELEGIFNKLIAYSTFTNSEITDTIVDTTIETTLVNESKVMSSKLVMQIVANYFNIKVSDILSEKRSNSIAFPRQVAMYLCRDIADLSFPAIGKEFGGRDHSTVLHAYGKVKDTIEKDEDVRNMVNEIIKKLESPGEF